MRIVNFTSRNHKDILDEIEKDNGLNSLKDLLKEWESHHHDPSMPDSWEEFILRKRKLSVNPRYRATAIAQRLRRLRVRYKTDSKIDLHALDRRMDTALAIIKGCEEDKPSGHAVLRGEDFKWTLKVQKILNDLYRSGARASRDINSFSEAMERRFNELRKKDELYPGI